MGGKRYVIALCRTPKDAILWRRYYQKPDVVPENRTGQWGTLQEITGGRSERKRFLSFLLMALFQFLEC